MAAETPMPTAGRLRGFADRLDGLDIVTVVSVALLGAGLTLLLGTAWMLVVLGGVGLAWVGFVAVVEKLATLRREDR